MDHEHTIAQTSDFRQPLLRVQKIYKTCPETEGVKQKHTKNITNEIREKTITCRKTVGMNELKSCVTFPIFTDAIANALFSCRIYFRKTTPLSSPSVNKIFNNSGGSGIGGKDVLPE